MSTDDHTPTGRIRVHPRMTERLVESPACVERQSAEVVAQEPPKGLCVAVVASLAIAVTLFGDVGTVVFLNWWFTAFPGSEGAPFAIQLSSSLIYLSVFMAVGLVCIPLFGLRTILVVIKGKGWQGLRLSVWMGLADLLSNIIAVYATAHTPEILQGFLQTTVPPWALVLQYWLVKGQRSMKYKDKFLIGSGLCAVVGIVGSAIPAHPGIKAKYTEDVGSFVAWVFIYASSAILYAWWCVLQRLYCDNAPVPELLGAVRDDITSSESRTRLCSGGWLRGKLMGRHKVDGGDGATSYGATSGRGQLQGDDPSTPRQADETSELLLGCLEKILMLLGDTFFQVLWTFVILPMDAIPWFGTSPNVAATWTSLVQGLHCVLSCPSNLLWCALYSICYFASYLGDGYLNHISPTLCCIIIQLEGPVTALVLIVVPSWNVAVGGDVLWWQQGLAGLVMVGSAVLYYQWERQEERRQQEEEGTETLEQEL